MPFTDEDLLLASRSDGDRFGELFDRHFATIYRYLHRRVGSDLADELALSNDVTPVDVKSRNHPNRRARELDDLLWLDHAIELLESLS